MVCQALSKLLGTSARHGLIHAPLCWFGMLHVASARMRKIGSESEIRNFVHVIQWIPVRYVVVVRRGTCALAVVHALI